MAATGRLKTITYLFLLLIGLAQLAHASPLPLPLPRSLEVRGNAEINNETGTPQVFNPVTQQPIQQSPASDGGGSGLDAPAIIWIGFSIALGIFLSLAGVRGWRVTTGVGVGLATSVCAWAAVNNSVSANGPSDIIITIITLGFFVLGFAFGVFEVGRLAGMAALSIAGGVSLGVRVVLLRGGLLIPIYFLNWIVVALLGAVGGGVLLAQRRVGITGGCAACGSFLLGLGVDLIMARQDMTSMSRGLRFLFDRNASHLGDIVAGYHPSLLTQIILGASIGLTPALAYMQHRLFPAPFRRKSKDDESIYYEGEDALSQDAQMAQQPPTAKIYKSRFSAWSYR